MTTNIDYKHREVIKTALMEAAQRSTTEKGFASTKELWEAILDTFFTGRSFESLPTQGTGSDSYEYRQRIWQYQTKKISDIQFLELYQKYLEGDLSGQEIAYQTSPTWQKIAGALIVLRDHLRHTNQFQQSSECLMLGKLYLENEPGKAVDYLATNLLNILPWHLTSEITTSLFYTVETIDLLLTAHEKAGKKNPATDYPKSGITAMTILLERAFGRFRAEPTQYRFYSRDDFPTVYHLSRLYCLKGEISNAIDCLRLFCTSIGKLDWVVKTTDFDFMYNLPKLWHRLALLQHQRNNSEDAKESINQAKTLISQYLESSRVWFLEHKQLNVLERYLTGNADQVFPGNERRFSEYSQLLQLQTSIDELLALIS